MGRMKRSYSALLLIGGCLIGATVLFLIALLLSGSARTATIFSVVPLGFFVPVVFVFALASAHPAQADDLGGERHSDVAIAVGYTASVIPYWFSAISAVNGRIGLSSVLFIAYVAMAAVPLRSMLRVRRLIEGGMNLRSR